MTKDELVRLLWRDYENATPRVDQNDTVIMFGIMHASDLRTLTLGELTNIAASATRTPGEAYAREIRKGVRMAMTGATLDGVRYRVRLQEILEG